MAGEDDPGSKLVLIVEDDDDIRELLTFVVKAAGFQTDSASRGEEGIQKLALKPHGIILDLIMPGCGGLGVLAHIKTLPPPLPAILVITAFQDQNPVVTTALQDPNVTQCLRKPIHDDQLVVALHRYLGTQPLPKDS